MWRSMLDTKEPAGLWRSSEQELLAAHRKHQWSIMEIDPGSWAIGMVEALGTST